MNFSRLKNIEWKILVYVGILLYEKTKMDLEIFIHGALCISYSGQCLMSSIIIRYYWMHIWFII